VGKVNVNQKLVPFKLKRSAIMTWIAKVPLSKIKEQSGRLHHHDRLAGGGPEAVGVEDDAPGGDREKATPSVENM
jgi:hypothetical protein